MSAVICIRTRSTVSPFGEASAPSAFAPSAFEPSGSPASGTPGVTTRLRLTQRGRIVFTTLAAAPLVVLALVLAVNGGVALASTAAAPSAAAFDYVTISAGESLWDVAETIAPDADPRDVIADIVSLNQLSSEDVEPGQRLALPSSH